MMCNAAHGQAWPKTVGLSLGNWHLFAATTPMAAPSSCVLHKSMVRLCRVLPASSRGLLGGMVQGIVSFIRGWHAPCETGD